jgi:hypothetical protein
MARQKIDENLDPANLVRSMWYMHPEVLAQEFQPRGPPIMVLPFFFLAELILCGSGRGEEPSGEKPSA